MARKFVVVVDDYRGGCYAPFKNIGEFSPNPQLITKNPEDVALVVFTGGEDVSPSLYNEKPNRKTYSNLSRDLREKSIFESAVAANIPIAGICRGSQLLCALSGGKLIQHVSGHAGSHIMTTNEGEVITVTSTHHQMQLPPPESTLVGWAAPKLSSCYEGPPGVHYKPEFEYEIVHYPHTKALAMQYHPEFMSPESRGFKYCEEIVRKYLLK